MIPSVARPAIEEIFIDPEQYRVAAIEVESTTHGAGQL